MGKGGSDGGKSRSMGSNAPSSLYCQGVYMVQGIDSHRFYQSSKKELGLLSRGYHHKGSKSGPQSVASMELMSYCVDVDRVGIFMSNKHCQPQL